jgi:hypothetical protein
MDISRPDSTLTELLIDDVLMDRMVRAVERVRDRSKSFWITPMDSRLTPTSRETIMDSSVVPTRLE